MTIDNINWTNFNKSVYYGAYLTDMSMCLFSIFFIMGLSKSSYEQVRSNAENCILSAMDEYNIPNDPQLFAAFFAVYIYNLNFIELEYEIYEWATSSVKEKFIVDVSVQMKQAIQDRKDSLLSMLDVLRIVVNAWSAAVINKNMSGAMMETKLFVKDFADDCRRNKIAGKDAIIAQMTAKKAYEMQSDVMYQSR